MGDKEEGRKGAVDKRVLVCTVKHDVFGGCGFGVEQLRIHKARSMWGVKADVDSRLPKFKTTRGSQLPPPPRICVFPFAPSVTTDLPRALALALSSEGLAGTECYIP